MVIAPPDSSEIGGAQGQGRTWEGRGRPDLVAGLVVGESAADLERRGVRGGGRSGGEA
jgi:hypothetical protein